MSLFIIIFFCLLALLSEAQPAMPIGATLQPPTVSVVTVPDTFHCTLAREPDLIAVQINSAVYSIASLDAGITQYEFKLSAGSNGFAIQKVYQTNSILMLTTNVVTNPAALVSDPYLGALQFKAVQSQPVFVPWTNVTVWATNLQRSTVSLPVGNYTLESSTNLRDWEWITNVQATQVTSISFTNQLPMRFFRLQAGDTQHTNQ